MLNFPLWFSRFIRKSFFAILGLFLFSSSSAMADNSSHGIPPLKAADYIHAVIEADRTIYSEVIVERLGVTINLKASENWREEDALPLPAQFLLLSSQNVESRGIGMKFRLMSLWPINKENGPKTKFEKIGLEKILSNPEKPFTQVVSIKGKPYFKAIYADLAVTKACVQCHNNHPASPKKDFKIGDVMGGISVILPLENNFRNNSDNEFRIPAEVVADYVHAVLDSDRKIYSEVIVNRLKKKNIVYASEDWWEDNALLLPAQFLLNASDLIINKNIDLDFKLISPWPINKHNGPANEFERKAIKYVVKHPMRPYIEYREVGGQTYFQAVYPDFAVSRSCIDCHNAHPKSPKKDFKLNDVMGGIVMTFPVK